MTLEFESFVRVRNAGEQNTWSSWGLLCGKISKMMTSSWDYTEDLFDVKKKKELNKIHKENGAEDFRMMTSSWDYTEDLFDVKKKKELNKIHKENGAEDFRMMTSLWDYTEDLFDVKKKKELNKIHKENGAEDFRTDLALNLKEGKMIPADGKQRAASAEAELSKCEILTSGDISLNPGHSLLPPGSSPLIEKKRKNSRQKPQNRRQTLQCKKGDFKYVKFFLFAVCMTMHFDVAHAAPIFCGQGQKYDPLLRDCLKCDPGTYSDKHRHRDESCKICLEANHLLHTEIEKNCTPTSNTKLRCEVGYQQDPPPVPNDELICSRCPQYPLPCDNNQTTQMPPKKTIAILPGKEMNKTVSFTNSTTANKDVSRKINHREPPDDSSEGSLTVKIMLISFITTLCAFLLILVYTWFIISVQDRTE